MAATTFIPKLIFPIYRHRKLIHLILVYFPMFSGSMNTIKAIMVTLDHYFGMCCYLEFHNDQETHRDLTLVAISMFSGSINPIRIVIITLIN